MTLKRPLPVSIPPLADDLGCFAFSSPSTLPPPLCFHSRTPDPRSPGFPPKERFRRMCHGSHVLASFVGRNRRAERHRGDPKRSLTPTFPTPRPAPLPAPRASPLPLGPMLPPRKAPEGPGRSWTGCKCSWEPGAQAQETGTRQGAGHGARQRTFSHTLCPGDRPPAPHTHQKCLKCGPYWWMLGQRKGILLLLCFILLPTPEQTDSPPDTCTGPFSSLRKMRFCIPGPRDL